MSISIDQFVREAIATLADSPSPRLDAEVLAMHVIGLTRAQLITHGEQPLSVSQEQSLRELLTGRARGEPVAYLTGRREFWSLPLHITPAVLIPRPETELLVEHALTHIPPGAALNIADLGTGSGAIALALAHERPHCRIVATDASPAALAVARANAQRLGLSAIELRAGEWFAPLTGMRFDVIVANPPYVAENDPHLGEGDVRFEPRGALASGPDGLDAIRRIARDAPTHLQPGGRLLIEHGADQRRAVTEILAARGFVDIGTVRDLADRDRVTSGLWPT